MEIAPTTLGQLYDKARADLGALKPGVLLEWAWINAQAVGLLERARSTLKWLEDQERDFRFRAINAGSFPIEEATRAYIEGQSKGDTGLDFQRRQVEASAAYVRATEHVMALLERAATRKAAKQKQDSETERPKAA